MSDTITSPYDFILQKLDFITSQGQTIDLRGIFTDLNIYEDIFANVMSGNLTVTDSTNIFGYIVASGNEFLHIVLDKPGLNKPIDKQFRVYNRPSIAQSKPTNQMVTLGFCSEELLISKSLVVSKIYSSMLISDMVKDITSNILKINPTNFPSTNIETTKGMVDITLPYYNPFQSLNWLASKATSSYVGASYFFFENQKGFNFKSLQNLMDINQPVATYNKSIKNVSASSTPGVSDANLDFYNVDKYSIIKVPDTLDHLISGAYSGKLETLDILRQQFVTKDLNADDLFNASVSVAGGKPYNNFSDRLGNQTADSYGGYRKFYPTNLGQNQAQYIQGKQQVNPSNIENWLIERNAQIMQILGNRVKIVVPGNNTLKVGDIICFNMPSIESQTGTNEGEVQIKLDPYFSGNYLISAIRHHVTVKLYETVMELCRDTLQKSVPNTSSSPGVGGLS